MAGEGARRWVWVGFGTEWCVIVGVLAMGGGPSSVTVTPLALPLTNVDVGVPDVALPVDISGDCCGSRTRFGVQSEEFCMMWRFEGRLVLRESEGLISG